MAQLGATTVVATAVTLLALFVSRFLTNRRHVRKLQEAKAPMPAYHPVFGHLVAVKKAMQNLPRNVTTHVMVRVIAKQFPKGIFYLNLWPFNKTLMVVANPYTAAQIEAAFLDKPQVITDTLEVIMGGPSLMTMHGGTWKKWRALFNPGFAPNYITRLAPAIADETAVLCQLLHDAARQGDMFQLEEYTLRLTFDIISQVTLGSRLHYQTQGSVLADGVRRQVYWTPFATSFNPFRRFLSPRPLIQKYTSFCIDRYLSGEIDKRFDELVQSRRDPAKHIQARSVLSLVMDEYLKDVSDTKELSREAFKQLVIPQLRLFLYAGHDTTSSTLLYCYYLLFQHPDILEKVRSEHDTVFGSDFSIEHIQQEVTRDATQFNKIPYTQAVIKEVLRLFPPGASIRDGRSDLILTDEDGKQYPTEDCYIWTLNLVMHHSPEVFAKPDEFIPDRWLVEPHDPLYPKKGSWRAFEWGPRACIGQTLAQLELKVVLVMTLRMFDINVAYAEWDKKHAKKGITTVEGNRVYQAEMGGAGSHPVDGFPVKITLRA
ncbi:hypothetical protein PFICI_13436 [Pestalotiopsis fici W106-1]|uniref:Cytochrome P450 n=1 Tax=Pestalotiopsis fici (strain W106-1 / CGMCC3.15140) TaxID=1229662 RepID=W3WP90_PESFW|nr:uncharacterized protein PFICI_13436 [Pestalotiopsis fici W106-1]ETS74952.1 hypothetical protein PFICI_13436 [Pestalotiopsis fici W106-1]